MIRKSMAAMSLLSLITVPAWAGFYAGVGGGPDMGNFDVNAHVYEYHAPHFGFNAKDLAETSGTGGFGTLFVGYGVPLDAMRLHVPNLYLGVELNADGSTLRHQNSNDEFVHGTRSSTKYELDYSLGASILPGYLISDATMVYGRVGYSNGRFKVTTSDVSLANLSKHLSGIRWGLGLEQMIVGKFALRVEYSHIDYRSTTVGTFDVLSSVTKVTTFTPHTNEVEFGLVYNIT